MCSLLKIVTLMIQNNKFCELSQQWNPRKLVFNIYFDETTVPVGSHVQRLLLTDRDRDRDYKGHVCMPKSHLVLKISKGVQLINTR